MHLLGSSGKHANHFEIEALAFALTPDWTQALQTQAYANNTHNANVIQHFQRTQHHDSAPKYRMTTFLDYFSHREGQNRRPTKAVATTRGSSTPVSARRAPGRLSAGRAEVDGGKEHV